MDENIISMDELLAMDANSELPEGWRISNDTAAEWALMAIRDAQSECNRLCRIAAQMIEQYERQINRETRKFNAFSDRMTAKLRDYFATVPHKYSKTQETYKLLSGSLRLKHHAPARVISDAKALTEWIALWNPDALVTVATPKWNVINKSSCIHDGKIVTLDTGEILPGVSMVDRPDTFDVGIKPEKSDDGLEDSEYAI